jgi:hypothetical protein
MRIANLINKPNKHEFSFIKKNGEIGHTLMSVDVLKEEKNILPRSPT